LVLEREASTAGTPRIGIVIPTLNEASTLPALLERLGRPLDAEQARETFDHPDVPDEIVVVDGGSHDETRELASRAGVAVIRGHRGRGAQLARGASALSTDVLLFLHSDTTPDAGALEVLRDAYRDESVQWSAMAQYIAARGTAYRWIERASNGRARRGRVFGDCGLAMRKEVYARVGGFADLPIFEDVELAARLRRLAPVQWLAGARLSVSPRRWEREGQVRCTLRNWTLRMAFWLGVSPAQLARCYPPHSEADAKE